MKITVLPDHDPITVIVELPDLFDPITGNQGWIFRREALPSQGYTTSKAGKVEVISALFKSISEDMRTYSP